MRRKIRSLAAALLVAAAVLSGCGSPAGGGTAGTAAPGIGQQTEDSVSSPSYGGDSGSGVSAKSKTGDAKLIYTAGLEMETTAFDEAARGLAALTEQCGGYFESSSVENYSSGYRRGTYTVRVPAKQFSAFCQKAGQLCHVLRQDSAAQDVSEAYYDTAGRLKTQQTKLERLQALLAKAEKMEDIITIESAISDTEQQIESLSGQLQHYDTLVDYSTVNLTLNEVYKLSNVEEPAVGFASRIGAALRSGWKNFTGAVEGFLLALAYGWVWILLLAAAAAAVLGVRRKRGHRLPGWKKPGLPGRKNDKTE